MASKVISVTEEVYDLLKSIKLPNESFGDTIKRLCTQYTADSLLNWVNTNPLDNSIPDDIWQSLEDDIKKLRERKIVE